MGVNRAKVEWGRTILDFPDGVQVQVFAHESGVVEIETRIRDVTVSTHSVQFDRLDPGETTVGKVRE